MYLLNAVLLGAGVWIEFMHRQAPWEPLPGVAFGFWAALAVLSALGIRYPLAMLPILFIQLFYKTFFLLAVSVPLRAVGRSTDLTRGFVVAIVLDVIVIPWGFVLARYIRQPADKWK